MWAEIDIFKTCRCCWKHDKCETFNVLIQFNDFHALLVLTGAQGVKMCVCLYMWNDAMGLWKSSTEWELTKRA